MRSARACATCGRTGGHARWCFDVRKRHFLEDFTAWNTHGSQGRVLRPEDIRHWDEFAPVLGAALERGREGDD